MKELQEFNVGKVETNEKMQTSKGTQENPFSLEEFNSLDCQNEWRGGYVEGLGMMGADSPENTASYLYGLWEFNPEDDEIYSFTIYNSSHGNTDCTYLTIGSVIGVSSAKVADLYGNWLMERRAKSHRQAQNQIDIGMNKSDIFPFCNSIMSKYGWRPQIIPDNYENELNSPSGTYIGTVSKDGGLHEIIIHGIKQGSNYNELDYDDIQNPNTTFALFTYNIVQLLKLHRLSQ